MPDSRDSAVPPLDAADPRISEWLDGRLPVAEAAEVERAVMGSPELAAVVADLRKIRAGLRSLPATALPAGFSGRVMEGVRAARGVVDSESRSPARQRFPWAVLATALAGGLLMAVVLNLSEPADREVAVAPTAADDLDVWLPVETGPTEPPPAAAPPAAAAAQDGSSGVALEAEAAAPLRPQANEFAVEFAAEDAAEPAAKALARAAPLPPAARSRKLQLPAVPAGLVVIAIAGPDERLAIERLVADSGLEVASVAGRIELTGRAAAIDAFLARLERDGWVAGPLATRRQPAREAAQADDRRQLILRLVDRRPPPRPETKAAADAEQP